MLLRLVLFFFIACVVYSLFRSPAARRRGQPASKLKPEPEGEEMVLDPQCQSYVPKSNAVSASGRYFCSQECAQLYLSR